MPRLQRLNGDLDTTELHGLAVSYVHFAQYTTSILEEAAREGAVLVEVRFGVGAGLGPRHMSLFREAERRVRKRYPCFYTEAIAVIRVPTVSGPGAFETILHAADQGLAGIDFIPDPYDSEANWTEAYGLAERAAEAGLGITAHLGEVSAANIEAGLRLPGLKRVGHAVHATTSDELLQQVLDAGVTVECCLTSNLVLGDVPALNAHPIRMLAEAGVPITLASDDPVRICTSIAREYELAGSLGFGTEELLGITRQAIRASFTSTERKQELFGILEGSLPISVHEDRGVPY
jgi:imidazolonepropionase-like amidohydrolase